MSRADKARQLAQRFLETAHDRLERLSDLLLRLESAPSDHDAHDELMREIHTLKGESRLFGFTDVSKVAHKTEELLLAARALGADQRRPVHEVIFSGLDTLTSLLQREGGAEGVEVDIAGFEARADESLALMLSPAAPIEPLPEPRGEDAARKLMRLRAEGTLRVDLGKLGDLTDLTADLLLSGERSMRGFDEVGTLVKQLAAELDRAQRDVHLSEDPTETIERLESRAGEWRTLSTHLRRTLDRMREHFFDNRLLLEQLDGRVRGLRLQPLGALFRQYPRAVRDLSAQLGKEVVLDLHGADVEVDKQVLEVLAEPLLHLIRNALDHGIEPPDERVAAGKAPAATLTISARPKGAMVEIRVSDDGRGIDAAKVRRVARARGLIDEEAEAGMGDDRARELLFAPGFSTADEVSDVSGRGVGLDVARARLEELGGSVVLESRPGEGTALTLTAPVTSVVMRALVVEAGGSSYALLSEAVESAMDVPASAFGSAGGAGAVRLDDGHVPVIDLASAFGSSVPQEPTASRRVAVLHQGGRRVAALVDRFLGEQQIVQRSTDAFLAGHRLVAGTASLDSGAIAVLLDAGELIRRAEGAAPVPAPVRREAQAAGATVLIVDDSEITRDLLGTILRAHGHRVVEAVNGREGVERIRDARPDMVITDLEMPVMDGFGLLVEVRSDPAFTHLPVVVFTTRSIDADRKRAAELGASGYLVKSRFDERELLAMVDRFTTRAA